MLRLPAGPCLGRVAVPALLASLLASVLAFAGCERPTLDLGHVPGGGGTNGGLTGGDTSGTSGDGGSDAATDANTTGGGDATAGGNGDATTAGTDGGGDGGTSGTPDAGCADDDDDGVCNAEDSCPDIPNAGDETGAACECDVSVPTGTVTAPSADTAAGYVGDVDINGSGSNAVAVAPGSSVDVRFRWAATQCFFTGTNVAVNQHIAIGLEAGAPDCAVQTSCTPSPPMCVFDVGSSSVCPLDEDGSATLTAPDEPGEYYILMDHDSGSCSGWPDGVPPDDQRIGAICVR